MHNLLVDPLIRVRRTDGIVCELCLPDVLAELSRNAIESFCGISPHQKHSWHAFLVQLAAITLHRDECAASPTDASEWRTLLRTLTPGFAGDEPWCLIVEDLAKPAFMQPPVPEGQLNEKWKAIETPDGLDILVTAKNHDVKSSRLRHPHSDLWLYALVNLQTMEGYSGPKNYGISRMNSGCGNRPCVALTPGNGVGERLIRDLKVLLKKRDQILEKYEFFEAKDGKGLLWLEPWDGKKSLPLKGLDPYYIEICRRVRIERRDDRLLVRTTSSKDTRIAGKEQKGKTGDPWTPINVKGDSGLTVGGGGFNYNLLRQILFSADYKPSPCQEPLDDDPAEGIKVHALAMSRGQGVTAGLYERRIPIPKKARDMLRLGKRDIIGGISQRMVEEAGAMRKILSNALRALLQGGPEKINFKDERAGTWLEEYDRYLDGEFFRFLWEAIDIEDSDEREKKWQEYLVTTGRTVLREAEQALPVPDARRYKALAAADGFYEGSTYKNFPLLRREKEAV